MNPAGVITLSHGAGGRKMQRLITDVIMKHLANPVLSRMDDSGITGKIKGRVVATTDSFVVSPLFFSGGDIGRLAVCGTVNDLTAVGAKPLCLTAGFILEEGFPVADLIRILSSIRKTCAEAGVFIAAGDTKVVERGKADGIYINTAGIGEIPPGRNGLSGSDLQPGDAVLVTGTLGDHEIAILKERKGLGFEAALRSDCAPLNTMLLPLLGGKSSIRAMRDPTRGGLAAVLNETASASKVDIRIREESIPVHRTVRAACSLFGFDPLNLANEGKMVLFCAESARKRILASLKKHPYGRHAACIGKVLGRSKNPRVFAETSSGGERIVLLPEGEQLPRIC